MPRRFQFSLKALLALTATICLALGGWHMLNTYGNYMEVGDLAVGKPIRVKGRFIRVFGPQRRWIQVVAVNAGPLGSPSMGGGIGSSNKMGWVNRSWLCCYEFEYELDAINTPGRWGISAGEAKGMALLDEQFKTFDVTGKQSENYP
jgi:hypothetical protein